MDGAITRIESFPFDSAWAGYDDEGYPIYDRAVGSAYLRAALRQFFTTGVFGTPADALMVQDAGDGMNIQVGAGLGIIDGAIGGIIGDEPLTLELTTAPTVGKAAYGVFLRLDDNSEFRSLYIRIAKGSPASDPVPPDIDTSDAAVKEIRLGYVIVPSNASDLTGAEFVDERGTEVCPYAAPFEEIDISNVINNVKWQAANIREEFNANLTASYQQYLSRVSEYNDQIAADHASYLAYVQRYEEVIDAALGEGAAAEIMRQINAIGSEPLSDADFAAYVTRQAYEAGTEVVNAANIRALTGNDLAMMATEGADTRFAFANLPFIAVTEAEYAEMSTAEQNDGHMYVLYNAE